MTASQRARLVVALGVVNLVLATIALAVGTVGVPILPPTVPRGSDAANLPSTSPSALIEPSASAAPTRRPQSPSVAPSPTIEPSTSPALESPLATEVPVTPPPVTSPPVAAVPSPASPATPRPRPATTSRPAATPSRPAATPTAPPPTPAPPVPTIAPPPPTSTARPSTPSPIAPPQRPTPGPVDDGVKVHPPCPDRFAPPPGHAKVEGSKDRPCRPGKGRAGGADGGFIVVAPLALAGWAARRAHLSSRGMRRPRRR